MMLLCITPMYYPSLIIFFILSCIIFNIQIPKIENPSTEDVNKYHTIFYKQYERIFKKYKGIAGMENRKLKICCS